MKKIFLTLHVCIILVMCCINICFGENINSKQTSIYYKEVPQGLSNKITLQIKKYEKKYPMSLEEKAELPSYISGFSKLDDESRTIRISVLRRIGSGALSIISNLLSSKRVSDRKDAFSVLFLFTIPHEFRTKDYDQTEELLISILQRSLNDESPEIRRNAVSFLFSIARERHPKIPEIIITSLKDTMKNDPDKNIRLNADECLQDLGVLPRDPNRKWILD